jgi:hypothetical protein
VISEALHPGWQQYVTWAKLQSGSVLWLSIPDLWSHPTINGADAIQPRLGIVGVEKHVDG